MPEPTAGRLPSLTGMRWAAALLVFGLHAYSFLDLAVPHHRQVAKFLCDGGDLGVSFFFVLSGFVLAWSARPGDPARRFWRRRFARIYPSHLVALLFALGCLLVTDRLAQVSTERLLTGALLVQAWSRDPHTYLGINPVTWSLSCEATFYLCFPALYALLRRAGTERLRLAAVALVALVWLFPVLASVVAPGSEHWMVYVWPLTRLAEFVLGIVLALLVRAGAWRGPGLALATAGYVASYLTAAWLPAEFRDTSGTIVAVSLLIPAGAMADLRGTRSFWRHPYLVRLGEVSFAFYLVHYMTIDTADVLLGRERAWPTPQAVAVAGALLLLSCVLAVLLHRYVELPGVRLLSGSRRPAPVPRVIPAASGAPAAGTTRAPDAPAPRG
ncbi:acyltransferase family protein [Carbonactinospora thermoautotrophica]|uniref:acyltransferase family protein n=1 Tax=Carbonactinospora thermoautotrophica TaxID=1469144 RepID=UPI00226FCB01|nr:acyltransferase [Carbonactinospora thermoautotrophica]